MSTAIVILLLTFSAGVMLVHLGQTHPNATLTSTSTLGNRAVAKAVGYTLIVIPTGFITIALIEAAGAVTIIGL